MNWRYRILDRTTKTIIDEAVESYGSFHVNSANAEIIYNIAEIKRSFKPKQNFNSLISLKKYQLLLPIKDNNYITLQEGSTPLLHAKKLSEKYSLKSLYLKNEALNPTGAFKDRGSAVEITKAVEYNAKAVVVASTGNMAASVSAYCAVASLLCFVVVPKSTSPAKLTQISMYGAIILKVNSDYDYAVTIANRLAREYNLYLAGDFSFRLEGQKTLSFELIEQMNFHVPDYIIVPTGNGTNISAIWKGFKEYHELGLINKLPKMIGVQVAGYDPISREINTEHTSSARNVYKNNYLPKKKSVASAISVNNPSDGDKVIELIKESKGFMVTVSDDHIRDAQNELARTEALFVEPSSATTLAAIQVLNVSSINFKKSVIIGILTGNGLKDIDSIEIKYETSHELNNTVSSLSSIVKRYIKN